LGIRFIPKPWPQLDTHYIIHRGSSLTSHPIHSKRHYATPCTLMTAYYSNAINPTQYVIISYDVVYARCCKIIVKLKVLRGSEEIIYRSGNGSFAFGRRAAWILIQGQRGSLRRSVEEG